MLGGRYDQYRFRSTNISNETRSYNGHSFSPNFGVVWVSPQHTLYASYNKASPLWRRSYLGISSSQNEIFNSAPNMAVNMRAGMKSDWLEGRLNTTWLSTALSATTSTTAPTHNNPYEWRVRGKERSQAWNGRYRPINARLVSARLGGWCRPKSLKTTPIPPPWVASWPRPFQRQCVCALRPGRKILRRNRPHPRGRAFTTTATQHRPTLPGSPVLT